MPHTTVTHDRRISAPPEQTSTPRRDTQPPREWPLWAIREREKWKTENAALQRRIDELERAILNRETAERQAREHEYQAQRALALYGERSDLDVVRERLKLHPSFAELPAQGLALVTQIGHAMGVNPFVHLHAWVDKRNVLNVTMDYKGLLFLADQDDIMLDYRYLKPEEMRARGISQIDIDNGAIACVHYVTQLTKAIRCKQAGIEYKAIEGYAVWYPLQTKQGKNGPYTITNEPPNGRDGAWVAWKNSLRAALYQIADMSLKLNRQIPGMEMTDDGWAARLEDGEGAHDNATVIDGAFTEVDPAEGAAPTPDAATDAPRTCARCGQPATDNPHDPTLCDACALADADLTASKPAQPALITADEPHRAESDTARK